MTEEYKKNVLAWLTGKYEIENAPIVTPTFSQVQNSNNNFKNKLQNEVGEDYSIIGFLQAKDPDNNTTNTTVVYGNTNENDGFICLIDEKFNIKQTIKQYSTGRNIDHLIVLNVAEDGSYYGIALDKQTQKRKFFMLNNFAIKSPTQSNYSVVYRIGYEIPTNVQLSGGSINGLQKVEGSAEYVAYGNITYRYGGISYYKTYATYFRINVGEENEWIDFTTTNSTTGTNTDAKNIIISKDEETVSFTIQSIYYGETVQVGYIEYLGNLQNEETSIPLSINKSVYFDGVNKTIANSPSDINIKNVYKNIYVSFITSEGDYCINLINEYTEEYARLIYYLEAEVQNPEAPYIELNTSDTLLFFMISQEKANGQHNIVVGIAEDQKVYTQNIGEVQNSPLFSSNQIFNLCNFYVQSDNTLYTTNCIYNVINYNGEPYRSLGSLNPNSGLLYDNNGIVVFARNLYNKIVNNNTTTSTIEVPNNYLNDIAIQGQQLLSKSNNVLNIYNETFIKNIYETVNINFFNTLIMKNNNNTQNEIINQEGAIRLNESVSNSLDYNDAKALKYRLNYKDSTSKTITISSESVEYSENIAVYDFYVYLGKEADTLDIISNDETTTYVSMDIKNKTPGKYYNIIQTVKII